MESVSNRNFTDLAVWQKARELKKEIFELLKNFPLNEKYRLSDQLLRAARSIISNIAEGHGRFTYKDQVHFCIQARGSLSETRNHLIDAFDCGYIAESHLKYFELKIDEVGKLINGYINHLRKHISEK